MLIVGKRRGPASGWAEGFADGTAGVCGSAAVTIEKGHGPALNRPFVGGLGDFM